MDKHPSVKLYIGDKHLSSWSMRPWLLMKHFEIPFEELLIRLDKNTSKTEIAAVSPSGRVPVLVDHDVRVWDSLSICEYLAEKYPRLNLWPDNSKLRALARSYCNEMHSGFSSLRKECPMNLLQVHHEKREISPETMADLTRIDKIFHDCRETINFQGNFLLGEFGILDAYFMPVIARIRSYLLVLHRKGSAEYFNHIITSPLFRFWTEESTKDAK